MKKTKKGVVYADILKTLDFRLFYNSRFFFCPETPLERSPAMRIMRIISHNEELREPCLL